ncbi:ATP-dependent helicase [Paenibacillus bouchesdurhonensis]|uniref:ATP-dependent helicase n=1 Tax=Paenibacillus bouchesdurhonensis TaxID=1870990 RepID=UPI000DA5F927|nr:ATP-dependent helicase [Paenibacillus bouchesdurhonensis]
MQQEHHFFLRKKQQIAVQLNEVQQQAVLHTEGPLLLLASPGSGKTTTLLMRIGYLIEEKGVQPSRIKAITFSRASAGDMKERYKRFFPELPSVDFSTIHSLAFEIVREYFRTENIIFQIVEGHGATQDVEAVEAGDSSAPLLHKKLILRDIFRVVAGENVTDDQLDELTTYISYIKNKMIPERKWGDVPCGVRHAHRILSEYERFKREHPSGLLIDFDDMLTLANEILSKEARLLRKYQQRYDYMLTDESQDTSLVQHAIIEQLVIEHRNLCVVADDDQSIYSWRGAEPSYLLEFRQVYPEARILYMEQNYRSSGNIVETANQFIQRNKNRYDKKMFTRNDEGQPISLKTLPDYKQQTKYLVEEIRKLGNLGEVAVLYRNNSSSIDLMNQFDRAGIPFYVRDADNRFFSHWVVQDILNFMRMSYTDRRPDILEAIHTKFNGYITKQQMAALKEINNNESVFDNLLNYVPLQDYQQRQLPQCKWIFEQMKGMPPLEAIDVIRTKLGYDKALDKMCERLGFRKEYLLGILNSLEEIAESLHSMEEFAQRLKHLEALLKSSKSRKGQHAVTFSTFHSAKGLEFKHVYMVDLINGILPSKEDLRDRAGDRNSELMEEAARLFYVGMTRAKTQLEMLTYQQREGEKTTESAFLTEVRAILNPPQLRVTLNSERQTYSGSRAGASSGGTATGTAAYTVPIAAAAPAPSFNANTIRALVDLAPGMQVVHLAFGLGKVTNISGPTDLIEIQFAAGVKRLSVRTCLDMGLLEVPEPVEILK